MYSIGTSAIRALRQKLKDLDPTTYADIIAALGTEDVTTGALSILRIVAFVGTMAERGNPADEGSTILAPYSAFFVIDETAITAQLYIPYDPTVPDDLWPTAPVEWQAIGPIFDKSFINNTLLVAGGFANAQYAFQRGMLADIDNAFKVDGIPYFARDTSALYIYDKSKNKWVTLNVLDDIGMLITYAEALKYFNSELPAGYLECDGRQLPINDYRDLWNTIGNTFNYGAVAIGHFMIPKQSNLLIRAVAR
jgi:hypothetical protein